MFSSRSSKAVLVCERTLSDLLLPNSLEKNRLALEIMQFALETSHYNLGEWVRGGQTV